MLAFRLTLPTWPVDGTWFFNPLAWQIVFVLGFTMGRADFGVGLFVRRHIVALRVIAVPIVILGLLVALFDWWPDPTEVPSPKLFFIIDKTFVTPPRLIQFLALVAVGSILFGYIRRLANVALLRRPVLALIGLLAMLGRNSLYVFCIGSLLSLTGQIVRFYYRGSVGIDTAVVISGIVIMAFTAWLAELRQRNRPARPSPSAQQS